MSTEEQLLGFDAREMWLEFDSFWSQERKELYLLRKNVEKPLSTDVLVWPAVIDVDSNIKSPSSGGVFNLWDDLQRLHQFLEQTELPLLGSAWTIGITLRIETASGQGTNIFPLLPVSPLTIDDSWVFLGYDISDRALLSGLSNCGYSPENVQSLRERWGPHLNKYHLFTDHVLAHEFREMTDARVKEHAPFFVYGLYLIQVN